MRPLIRPMRAADLPAIFRLQCCAHAPAYHEPQSALASRLVAAPQCCFVAEQGERLLGYLFAHPWAGAPPLLHQALPALPAAEYLFVHDLALDPVARGQGLAQALLQALFAQADLAVRLVALSEARGFWQRLGFLALPQALPAVYGEAQLMERRLNLKDAQGSLE